MGSLPSFLRDVQKIGFFGLGSSSLGMLEYLSDKCTATYTLRSDTEIKQASIPSGVSFRKSYIGNDAYKCIDEQVLFLSPSVNRKRIELQEAEDRGVKLSSDAELFFESARAPIFAVSGSDGKSTTTELAYRLLSSDYGRALKSGNGGTPMSPMLDIEDERCAHAVELSSFMLEYIQPKTYRALITNVTENHLDWHGGFDGYIAAKENLLKKTEGAALWVDDTVSLGFLKKYSPFAVLSYILSDEELLKFGAKVRVTLKDGEILVNREPILSVANIRRRESYNIKNFMSAIALCYGHFDTSALIRLAEDFSGIPHRCESLGLRDGVEYVNSSIDSSPSRTAVTLSGLARKVVLIMGGKGKGLSYEPLSGPVCKWASAVILNGENSEEIEKALMESPAFSARIPIYKEADLKGAVTRARLIARPGDTVLLSPASTSYDQFKNFEERGAFFKESISK